jgi:hypothetical protein
MSKTKQVCIKSSVVKGMYLDSIDPILGAAIPYMGPNPPTWDEARGRRVANLLNSLERFNGYDLHEWTIEKA